MLKEMRAMNDAIKDSIGTIPQDKVSQFLVEGFDRAAIYPGVIYSGMATQFVEEACQQAVNDERDFDPDWNPDTADTFDDWDVGED